MEVPEDPTEWHVKEAVDVERERCAAVADAWLNTQTLKLRAGEMTAQEVRSVRGVVAAIAREIRG